MSFSIKTLTDAFADNIDNLDNPHSRETHAVIERTFATALHQFLANPPTLTPAEQAYVDSFLSKGKKNTNNEQA